MNITFDDLCTKIGKLVVENEALIRRIQELEAENGARLTATQVESKTPEPVKA